MVKRNKTSILLSFFLIIAILMPKASAEEVNLAFKVNVAEASNQQQNTTTNNNEAQPLITEEAKKKQEETNKTTTEEETKSSNQTKSQPVQTSGAKANTQVISSSVITPTEPSSATGKIISSKNENGEEANKKQLEFIEFQTRNQKKLYLIIDRADNGKEVKLVTEVSEQDLASMVETKQETKQEEVVQEPPKQPTTEETKSSSGVSIFVYIFGLGVLGGIAFIIYAGFKKRQKKGREIEEDYEYEEYDEDEENEEDTEYYYDEEEKENR